MDFAYLREDAVRPPLSPRYTGPYKVMKQTRHSVVLLMGEKLTKHALARAEALQRYDDPSTSCSTT